MGRQLTCGVAVSLITVFAAADPARADVLRVLKSGLGSGAIVEDVATPRINCGTDCEETYGSVSVTLRATVTPGTQSVFAGWGLDCASQGTMPTCTVNMSVAHLVRAEFTVALPAIPQLADFTPGGINAFLTANPKVTTAARFISALSDDYKQNWILMTRSESLQTGTAISPRVLLPSLNAQRVFTIALTQHTSYPGAHPDAIEYMQWDAGQKNFRFHEIVVKDITTGIVRSRGVSVDDKKCFACHSTRNVLNRGTTPGTDRVPPVLPPSTVMFKNKPNWDSYDSWGGMMPFNRDRIYQGSTEAAAFRKLLNLWTWSADDTARAVIEQLQLQPPGVPGPHAITRTVGGANDGHINFAFDVSPPVLIEPAPAGAASPITTNYEFNGAAGTGTATSVVRGGTLVTLHDPSAPASDEGRGVDLFDFLGGLDGIINAERVADEIVTHRIATGNVPIDVRPLSLAIAMRCLAVSGGADITATQTLASTPALSPASTAALAFFNTRHGTASFNDLFDDTRRRSWSLTRRRADIQKLNLDRTGDPYIYDDPNPTAPAPDYTGLLQRYGAATIGGAVTTLERSRQEVFRRPFEPFLGHPDATVMGRIYVDREDDGTPPLSTDPPFSGPDNTQPVALFRYFLEPLGVSVDKWSMGVRGRSRAYTFADVFGTYRNAIAGGVRASLISSPYPGLAPAVLTGSATTECPALITAVDSTLASLPAATNADGPSAIPTYTDIQRILNKSCIECHGGLGYPPYLGLGTFLDFSEDENPTAPNRRLTRSYDRFKSKTSAPPMTDPTNVSNSLVYQRITNNGTLAHPYDPVNSNETCPFGLMPCGGPPLSKVDIETIKRWIIGGRLYSEGDPHIRTIDGVNYDFQSAGEFVLLRDEDLEIQTRQTAVTTAGPLGPNAYTGLSSCVSVNTAVALRVGSHRISYQPTIRPSRVERGVEPGGNALVLRIDGKPVEMSGREIPLPAGGRIVRANDPQSIQVEYAGGTVVVITPAFWTDHQIWYMNIDVRHARATEGVMGAIAPGNWLPALPDGSFMGPRPIPVAQRYQDLYEKFADAWRVTDATTLFDYEPGLSTASFTVDTWPMESPASCVAPPQPGGPPATAPLKTVTQAEAEKACSGVTVAERKANCVLDVMATGEFGFAETYLRTERIEKHAGPAMPVLESPADNADLTGRFTFTWIKSAGVGGGSVTFRHCLWNGDETYDLNRCNPIAAPVAERSVIYAGVIALLGLLLLLLLFFSALKHKRIVLIVLAIAIVPLILLAFYVGRVTSVSTSVTVAQLQPGKVYFWRVVAEDGEGGMVESPTRRFTVN